MPKKNKKPVCQVMSLEHCYFCQQFNTDLANTPDSELTVNFEVLKCDKEHHDHPSCRGVEGFPSYKLDSGGTVHPGYRSLTDLVYRIHAANGTLDTVWGPTAEPTVEPTAEGDTNSANGSPTSATTGDAGFSADWGEDPATGAAVKVPCGPSCGSSEAAWGAYGEPVNRSYRADTDWGGNGNATLPSWAASWGTYGEPAVGTNTNDPDTGFADFGGDTGARVFRADWGT